MPQRPTPEQQREQLHAIQEAFGRRLRAERLRRGVGQKVLAGGLRVSRTTVSNLERGVQRPYLDQVYTAAQILGVSAADLLPTEADLSVAPVITAAEPLSATQRTALERAVANVRAELSITPTGSERRRHSTG
jgi:transcriptional regulator with XRE-family HTH domain